jgi:hypothetical protein
MSILFSGDFNYNYNKELRLITKNALVKKYGQEKYDAIKYHIILGDAGFMWPIGPNLDKSSYEALAHRPFPILCVMGNREPIYGMSDRREIDIGIGETVYQIQDKPFVAYLKRGKTYVIDGFKFLVLGGALSPDKKRLKSFIGSICLQVAWWEEEYWSEDEKSSVFRLLETENKFDLVISHTGPNKVHKTMFASYKPKYFEDEVASLNDQINEKIHFSKWWFAHWYQDIDYFDPATKKMYQCFYDTTSILERVGDDIAEYKGNEMPRGRAI